MDILYITIVNRKIEIHTTTGIIKGSLIVQLEKLLSDYGFDKIDQSTIVNMKKINSFDDNSMKIHFENGDSCSVSRRNRKKVSIHFDKK